jgi:ankyrin repeat protein
MDIYAKSMWPVVRDVIYGDTTDLSKALEQGLSPSAQVHMSVYNFYFADANVSLLDLAIEAGQRNVIKLLLAHHASVNVNPNADEADMGYVAPLPYAAQFGEDDVIRMLLAHGANIEQRNNFKGNHETALAAAVRAGDVAGVYLLLARGASVRTALGPPYDCDTRSWTIRKLLIAHGAKMPPTCEIGGHMQ